MTVLISFLGGGNTDPSTLKNRNYRKMSYVLSDSDSDEQHTSPFVLDALLTLTDEEYDQVYLFGTDTSMWETLYFWAHDSLEKSIDNETEFERALTLSEGTPVTSSDSILHTLDDLLREKWQTPVTCKVIPHGENTEEFWQLLQAVLEHVDPKDSVTLDLTHGYRHIPIISLLALRYFTVVLDVEIRQVYYGAAHLSSHNQGNVPILDLKDFILPLLDWIDAGSHFLQTGDSSGLAELLPDNGSRNLQDLKKKLQSSALFIQYNSFKDISRQLVNLKDSITAVSDSEVPEPFNILKPKIRERLQNYTKDEQFSLVLAKMARQYYQDGQKVQALIVGYDAAKNAIAEALNYSKELTKEQNDEIREIIWQRKKNGDLPTEIREFFKLADTLRILRNKTSHSEAENLNPISTDRKLPEYLDQLHTILTKIELDDYV